MDQPKRKTPQFNRGGFIVAASLAPGMALAIWFLGLGLAGLSSEPGGSGTLMGGFLSLLLIVSLWGALPSLAFGGLVLAAIQRMPWRDRPTVVIFVLGGVVAAGLYVLMGLGIAALSPAVTMFFAPWAMPDLRNGPADWWVVASLLLAGAGAGLIYTAFAKRG